MTCENCAHNDVCDGYQLATDISPSVDWSSRTDGEKCDDFINNDDVVKIRCKDCISFKQSIGLVANSVAYRCDNPYGLKGNICENDFCCKGEKGGIQDDL